MPSRSEWAGRGALVLLSVGMCRVTLPPFDCWPLAPLAWMPLVLGCFGLSPRSAALVGLSHGLLLQGVSFGFIYRAMTSGAGWSPVSSLLTCLGFCLFQGARTGVVCLLVPSFRAWRSWGAVLLGAWLVLVERCYPMVIPWRSAVFVHAQPSWMQLAAWSGMSGLGFLLGGSAWLFAERARTHGAGRFATWGGVVACWGLLALGGAADRHVSKAAAAKRPALRIGLVQPNRSARDRELRKTVYVQRHASLELVEKNPDLDLVIWPETAISQVVDPDRVQAFFRDSILRDRTKGRAGPRLNVPLLAGVALGPKEKQAQPRQLPSNSAVLVSPDGVLLGRYDKRSLAPIGEHVPVWSEIARAVGLESSGARYRAGSGPTTILLEETKLGITICYEDILAERFRRGVQADPEVFVNLTSDSWFDGSAASALHFALAKFRAVEHGRYLVRSTTTGISGVVAPWGDVELRLPSQKSAAQVATVRALVERTWYHDWGDAPLLVLCAGLLVAFGWTQAPRGRTWGRRARPCERGERRSWEGQV